MNRNDSKKTDDSTLHQSVLCAICRQPSPDKSHLDSHDLIDFSFFCYICKDRFNSTEEVDQHIPNHYSKSKKGDLFRCRPCRKNFKTDIDLSNHIEADHPRETSGTTETQPFERCSSLDFDKICLEQRMEVDHSDTGKKTKPTRTENKPSKCDFCERIFYTTEALEEHTTRCHAARLFKCDICNKVCQQKYELERHRIHEHKKKFNFCRKLFSDLKGHVRRNHSNEGQSDRKLKKSNIKTSSARKQFECVLCKKRFDLIGSLRNHERTHPYRCRFCQELFKDDATLMIHVEKTHSK